MNIIIQNYTEQAVPNFCARKIIISKEQIIALRNQGKKETEIPKILGISVATYYEKLKQLGLSTAISGYRKKLADIPKDEFEKMLKEKAPIDTICKK
jgi:transposase